MAQDNEAQEQEQIAENDDLEIEAGGVETPDVNDENDDDNEVVDDQGGTVDEKIDQEKIDRIVQQRLAREKEKQRQLEKEKEEAERQRDELKKKYEPPIETLPTPPEPDILDPDYDQKAKERNEFILKQREALARSDERKRIEAENAQKAEQDKINAMRDTYLSHADKCGIKASDALGYAADLGKSFGDAASQDIHEIIINEPKGALVGQYLHNNPEEIEKIKGLPRYKQTSYMLGLMDKLSPGKTKKQSSEITTPESGGGGAGAGETDFERQATRGLVIE